MRVFSCKYFPGWGCSCETTTCLNLCRDSSGQMRCDRGHENFCTFCSCVKQRILASHFVLFFISAGLLQAEPFGALLRPAKMIFFCYPNIHCKSFGTSLHTWFSGTVGSPKHSEERKLEQTIQKLVIPRQAQDEREQEVPRKCYIISWTCEQIKQSWEYLMGSC